MQIDQKFLRRITCRVGKLPKGICGLYEQSSDDRSVGVITIDLNQTDQLGATIFHELIHALNPDWSERKVLAFERREWKRMSQIKKWQLLSWFFGKAYLKGGGDD